MNNSSEYRTSSFLNETNKNIKQMTIDITSNSIEAFQVDTQKINPDFSRPVEKIVNYVLENT
jgi:hypothetical protein